MNNTLYDNIFNNHIIESYDDINILFIDKILLHEVTSPQAFLSFKKNIVWNNKSILSTSDHNVSTDFIKRFFYDNKLKQLISLKKSYNKYFFKYYDLNTPKQGIIHIVAAENNLIYPGMLLICGDSHTTTNGALSTISNGVGTTDLSIALTTQCIIQKKLKTMKIIVFNKLKYNLTAKDLILHIIKKLTSKGGAGYSIEFSGECINNLSIAEKMTICNMSIEAGSKVSIVDPDNKLLEFYSNKVSNFSNFERYINLIKSKENSYYNKKVFIDANNIKPYTTWGTNLDTIINLDEKINTKNYKMLEYMGLKNDSYLHDIIVNKVFIGSCTNSRFEDLLLCSKILLKINKSVKTTCKAYVVPGSENIRLKSEFYGIDKIFKKYNFIWKNSGCSLCLAMNNDKIYPEERCVSTSNRNFIGRQGYKSRTHLASPILAVIIAIFGKFIDNYTYYYLTK